MAVGKVGIEVVLDGVSKFKGDADGINKAILSISGAAQSSGAGFHAAGSAISAFGGFLGHVFTIASGIIGANIFMNIANQIKGMASAAINATAEFQRLNIQFQGLIAREMTGLNQGEAYREMLEQGGKMTASQLNNYEAYRTALDQVNAAIAKHTEKGWTATATYQNLIKESERLNAKIQGSIQGYEAMDPWLRAAATGSLAMGDALKMAVGPAKELLDWIRTIAVTTPFETESLARTMGLSMAMGFTTEQSKELTMAMGTYTAAMGLSNDTLERIVYNFGQMKGAGKVTGTELRDLARGAMMPINDVLRVMQENLGLGSMAFGTFKERAAKGVYDVNEFFKAFIQMVNTQFPGAMERMANTWQTAKSNIMDFIKVFLGVDLLGPVFDRITTRLNEFLRSIMTPKVRASVATFGKSLETGFVIAEKAIKEKLLPAISDLFASLGFKMPAFEDLVSLPQRIAGAFSRAVDSLSAFIKGLAADLPSVLANIKGRLEPFLGLWDSLRQWWDDNKDGIISAAADMFGKIGEALQPVADALKDVFLYALDKIMTWLEENPDAVKNFFEGIGTFWEKSAGPALKGLAAWVTANKETVLSFFAGLAAYLIVFREGPIIAAGINTIGGALGGLAVLTGPLALLAAIIGTLTFGIMKFGSLGALLAAAQTTSAQIAVIIDTWVTSIKMKLVELGAAALLAVANWFVEWPIRLMEGFADIMALFGLETPKWYKAATALVEGFVQGIKDMIGKVVAMAVKMVTDAIAAAHKAGGARTGPWRTSEKMGVMFDKGLAMGITKASKIPLGVVEHTINHTVQAAQAMVPAPAMAMAGNGMSIGQVTINDPTDDMALMAMIRRMAGWT